MPPRRIRLAALAALAAIGAVLMAASALAQDGGDDGEGRGLAYSFKLDDAISPATESWVDSALDEAVAEGAEVAIMTLDTPGGLDSSTREIVQKITTTEIPVIVYVYPDGARAASAGAFITQAGDVAAMAPGTNIGSATPVSLGTGEEQDDIMGRKVTNDAAAYMRALAEVHDRNPDLGEEMVREATNVSAEEALEENFIDFVAASQPELLDEIDGFEISGSKAQVLDTSDLEIEEHEMPFGYRALGVLVNPTMAFLFMTIGLIGIAIEIFSPGMIFPGALGVIFMAMGLYGTAQLPVTWVGVFLLILAMGLLITEAQIGGTYGALGGPGILALVFSGLLLFNSDRGAEVSTPAIIAIAVLLGGAMMFTIRKVAETRRQRPWTGYEELIGEVADVRSTLAPVGQVFVEGALWRARAAEPGEEFRAGDKVQVEAVDGLTLEVGRPATPEGEEGEEGAH